MLYTSFCHYADNTFAYHQDLATGSNVCCSWNAHVAVCVIMVCNLSLMMRVIIVSSATDSCCDDDSFSLRRLYKNYIT